MNCPQCGKPGRYMKQQRNYFCGDCRKFFEGPKPVGGIAPMKKRIGAFLIDMLIILVVVLVAGILLPDYSLGPIINKTTLLLFFVMGIYFVPFHSIYGQTVGKKVFKIKVSMNGQSPLPAEVSFYRYLVKAISMILLFIGLLMAFANKEHRGLHDKLAETLVLEA
jgi:uncharacterized RDD family membrane protein YckC